MKASRTLPSFDVDLLDVRILRHLLDDPRIGMAAVAADLGVAEATVTRRFQALQRDGIVRVVGIVDPGKLGQSQWMLRLRCQPGSTRTLADALARRPDVSWVAVVGAGFEITCAVRARSRVERDDLLGRKLPRSAAVTAIDGAVILRQFVGGRGHYWAALNHVLADDEEIRSARMTSSPFVESTASGGLRIELDDHDERLLEVLAEDGRTSVAELASKSGLTAGRASRRLQKLLHEAVVHIDVEIAAAALGFAARANLWLRVHPTAITRVGRAMAEMPEIGFAAALSGQHNLHAVAHCRDLDELFELTSDRIGKLPGVETLEVGPILEQIKQAGTRLSGDRLTSGRLSRR